MLAPSHLDQGLAATAGTVQEVLVLAPSHLDQALAARRRLLLLVLILLLSDLPASQCSIEGQTWPSVHRGRWTGAGSEKHTRCTPQTLTSLGGGP